jgi:hypothetical protein
MAQAGFTPISLYNSSTAAAAPTAGNLANGELAINITDGKLFYKDNGGSVQVIAWKNVPVNTLSGTVAISQGGTGQTTASAAFNALSPITTTGDLIVGNGTNSATRLGIGANGTILTSNGTTATWVAAAPTGVTSFSAGTTGFTPSTGTTGAVTLAGTLAVANGGTGQTSYTDGQLLIGNSTGNTLAKATLTAGSGVSITNGSGSITIAATGSGGTVTSVSVVSANGLAGTVANATTTPAITLSTSVTGVLRGNGTAISAATAGTDYVAPGTATTFTATQTFSGSSSATALVLNDAAEVATVSATAATGTIAYDITTQSVLYYTSNASANWTVNFRGSSGTTLNTLMSTGQSMTVAFLVTQGTTAFFNNVVQVDGTTSGVTTRWIGGAPTAGNASGIDSYRYLIIKTGSATFTVLASLAQYKA